MFGIVFLLFTAVCTVCYWISIAKRNHDDVVISKQIAEKDGSGKRLCGDNRTWCDMKTGQHYTVERNLETGDMEKISTTGEVLENLTETKRKQDKANRIAKSGDSKYYVESLWENDDRLHPNRRRTYEQKHCHATRVVNKATGIDYFRQKVGDVYYYQDLDTAKIVDWEVVPECKGNKMIKVMVSADCTIKAVENTEENIAKSAKAIDEFTEEEIKKEEKFHNGREGAMIYAHIWS